MDFQTLQETRFQPEHSYNYQEWYRLRKCWNATCKLRKLINSYSCRIEQFVSEDSTYRDFASEVQNYKIKIRILEQNAMTAREMIRNTRYKLNAVSAKNSRLEQEKQSELDFASALKQIAMQQEQIAMDRMTLTRIQNELVFRRRKMFRDLEEIFFNVTTSTIPIYKKNCLCAKFDIIRGLHLPTAAARLGHNGVEFCAAISNLVLLLKCISAILCHPFKHHLLFYGSRSSIITRSDNESFNLYHVGTSKNNRHRFDHALYLLSEIVVQLRYDSGIGSVKELDRPIPLLHELILSFAGFHSFDRSDLNFTFCKCSNFLSPAVFINIKSEEELTSQNDKTSDSPILYNFLLPVQN